MQTVLSKYTCPVSILKGQTEEEHLALKQIQFLSAIIGGDFMSRKSYSKKLLQLLKEYLVTHHVHFSTQNETGVIRIPLNLEHGILKKVTCSVCVGKRSYTVYLISPLRIEPHNSNAMSVMAEFICRVNQYDDHGNFELDFESGEIRYKYFVGAL